MLRRRLSAALLISVFTGVGAWAQTAGNQDLPGEAPKVVSYRGHRLVQVTLATPQDVETMLAISGDFWSESLGLGQVPFRVAPERFADLQDSGLPFVVLQEDIQALIDRERSGVAGRAWFDDYKTYAEINAYIDTLVASDPNTVTKLTIGTSLQGNTIYGMEITGAGGAAGKPAVFFNGCQHAREWISPMTNMYIADQLVNGYGVDPEITALLDDVTVLIIPIVNPDGYMYTQSVRLWRKNRRNNGDGTFGVDLNRNWPFAWGGEGSSGSGSSETYRGPSPASEPETQAIQAFFLAHPEIIAHVDFHSFSQLILQPYGHTTAPPPPPEPDGSRLIQLGADMAAAIFDTSGMTYIDQEAWELYPAAGTMPDWAYDSQGILSWTIELRDTGNDGFILPADQIIPTGQENFEAIKVLLRFAAKKLDFSFPAALPPTVTPAGATTVQVNIGEINATLAAGTATLYARVGTSGPFTATAMTGVGGDTYEGQLPAAACGQVIQYYFAAETTVGDTVTEPEDAPTTYYQAQALDVFPIASYDMETNAGWSVNLDGDDDANTGVWNRMDPQPTAAQPGDDTTPGGTDCWVTDGNAGASVGSADIDGGKTTLFSPVLDLSAAGDPVISYNRWYSNTAGSAPNADVFLVEVTDDGSNWVLAEQVGPSGPETSGGWIASGFRVLDHVSLTSQVRVRFVASDLGSGSIVEAAIDDFDVRDEGCFGGDPCPGDLNGDLTVDLSDLATLLANFGSGSATPADGDIDGDGDVDLSDLATLLANFGVSC